MAGLEGAVAMACMTFYASRAQVEQQAGKVS